MTALALFKYDDLRPVEAQEVRAAAERIRVRMKRSVEDIIAIGQDLMAVKSRLPHGAFLPWIEAEFGMKDQTARNFMNVAERYADKSPNFGNLPLTAFYELAAPSTPDTVREAIEAKAKAGESVSVEEVKRLKREAAEAAKRAEEAEARAESLFNGQRALIEKAKADAAAKAKIDLDKANADAEAARKALEAERKKLSEATAKAEQAALDKAKAEADDLAQAALAKVEADVKKAKQVEADARKSYERIQDNVERARKKAEEYDAYLKSLTNGEREAKAIRDHLSEADRVLAMALLEMSDLEHEPPADVVRAMARTAKVCRDFAMLLDQYGGPRLVYDMEGAQA